MAFNYNPLFLQPKKVFIKTEITQLAKNTLGQSNNSIQILKNQPLKNE